MKARIDAIEESYEFFLAYAAQGLTSDRAAKSGGQLREFIAKMDGGLDGLGPRLGEAAVESGGGPEGAWSHFVEVVTRDAEAALAVLRLVGAQEGISSQLIDSLNANIHLRALLADLFVADELID